MEQEATRNPNMFAASVEMAAEEEQAEPIEHSLLEDMIAKAQAGLDEKVEEIRSDKRLTREEQRAQISILWDRACAAYPEGLKAYERVLAQDVEDAEDRLFHVGVSERDSVRSAYNDLHDRVSFLREQGQFEEAREELERFAVRARRTGDKPLATAVAHIACELGEEHLRDRWLSSSQEKQAAWDRLVEARRKQEHFNDPQERSWLRMTRPVALIKPPEA
jgi:tetratricopeptide (TPR) repeat protein